MRWSLGEFSVARIPLYHVYIEDDSFLCTDNMLHQTQLLADVMYSHDSLDSLGRRVLARGHKPFFTGFWYGDGYDDSSTFMSREIVEV